MSAIQRDNNSIIEGSATIQLPKGQVFYNPVQQFNRDLSIVAINVFLEEYFGHKKNKSKSTATIFEGLSATGLRSIRYAREIPKVKVFANDLDPLAVEIIKKNIDLNSLDSPGLREIVQTSLGDANSMMHELKKSGVDLDIIDLDPYGSAVPFLDSAVQTIADGGLLCVTCTDLAVLCASYPETCFAKYGGLPLKGDALRLVLQSIEVSANRYRRHVVPLLSCSIDFYELDQPFFSSLPEMASFLKMSVPPLNIVRSALLNSGHKVSGSHCEPQAIKTTAPKKFLWKIFNEWMKTTYSSNFVDSSPQSTLLSSVTDTESNICFDIHSDAIPHSKKQSLKRFPENPTKHWGPLSRAKKRLSNVFQ